MRFILLLAGLLAFGPMATPAASQDVPTVQAPVVIAPIKKRNGVYLDLTGQTVTKPLIITLSRNVTIIGGTFDGGGVETTGISVDNRTLAGPHNIRLIGQTYRGFTRSAVKIVAVDGFEVSGADISGMGSDGIDVSSSRRGRILDNNFHDFTTIGASHADALQFDKTLPMSEDVLIAGNTVIGGMQAFFGALRTGRVVGNTVAIGFANAVALSGDGTGTLDLFDTKISTTPGATTQARITLSGFAKVNRTGNVVAAHTAPGRKLSPALVDPAYP